jgi:hypothetical protein
MNERFASAIASLHALLHGANMRSHSFNHPLDKIAVTLKGAATQTKSAFADSKIKILLACVGRLCLCRRDFNRPLLCLCRRDFNRPLLCLCRRDFNRPQLCLCRRDFNRPLLCLCRRDFNRPLLCLCRRDFNRPQLCLYSCRLTHQNL